MLLGFVFGEIVVANGVLDVPFYGATGGCTAIITNNAAGGMIMAVPILMAIMFVYASKVKNPL